MTDIHSRIACLHAKSGTKLILPVVLGFISLTLASCGARPIQPETLVSTTPAEKAMVMPPPAGPGIVSVVERRFSNAVSQDIHLATSASTPGQNLLTVKFLGMESQLRHGDNGTGTSMVTSSRINSELRQAFPTVRMTRSQFFVQNNYGPFGYAFGRGRGTDLCMYAWQQIRSPNGTISPLANYGSIQIRLRLCEADATEAKLLGFMYNFTITGGADAPGWNPYGEPRSVDPKLGGSGAPMYPRPTASEQIVQTLPPRRTVVYAPQPSRPARPAAARIEREEEAPRGPLVPGPGLDGERMSRPVAPASGERAVVPEGQSVNVPAPTM